jgi:hypothetical protein
MPTTTTRLGLVQPIGTDPSSELRTSITTNADTLDNAALYFQGTLANRSTVVASPIAGELYYATDAELLYEDNGSARVLVLLAGAWQSLSLSSNIDAGTYTPSARLEGDTVRLKGVMQNRTGSTTASGTVYANLPSSSMYPANQLYATATTPGLASSPVSVSLTVATGGQITVFAATSNNAVVNLNGATFTLS